MRERREKDRQTDTHTHTHTLVWERNIDSPAFLYTCPDQGWNQKPGYVP